MVRETARYIVSTDVARCFPSIYTHVIPRALHTKPVAKANHGKELLGNILDKIVRESQDGQTIGIPIGPDTSYLLSEVILSAVDTECCSGLCGFRWYDDYELSGTTKSECESALAKLERALFNYELEINRLKTAVLELPLPIEEEWVQVLREFEFHRSGRGQFNELNSFFSRAFEFTQKAGKQPVLRYAVRKLNAADISPRNWMQAQRLMAHAAIQEPQVLPHVIGCLNFYEQRGYTLDKHLLQSILGSVCMEYAGRSVASEVAWAIWGYLQFSLKLPRCCVVAARDLEDDVVSLLLLDARRKGLIAEVSALTRLRNHVKAEAFEGDHWLLAYEGVRKGWIRPKTDERADFEANPHVHALLEDGVTFYVADWPQDASARHKYGTPSWVRYQ